MAPPHINYQNFNRYWYDSILNLASIVPVYLKFAKNSNDQIIVIGYEPGAPANFKLKNFKIDELQLWEVKSTYQEFRLTIGHEFASPGLLDDQPLDQLSFDYDFIYENGANVYMFAFQVSKTDPIKYIQCTEGDVCKQVSIQNKYGNTFEFVKMIGIGEPGLKTALLFVNELETAPVFA